MLKCLHKKRLYSTAPVSSEGSVSYGQNYSSTTILLTIETRCNCRKVLYNEPHEYHSMLPAILPMWGMESDSYMRKTLTESVFTIFQPFYLSIICIKVELRGWKVWEYSYMMMPCR